MCQEDYTEDKMKKSHALFNKILLSWKLYLVYFFMSFLQENPIKLYFKTYKQIY